MNYPEKRENKKGTKSSRRKRRNRIAKEMERNDLIQKRRKFRRQKQKRKKNKLKKNKEPHKKPRQAKTSYLS